MLCLTSTMYWQWPMLFEDFYKRGKVFFSNFFTLWVYT